MNRQLDQTFVTNAVRIPGSRKRIGNTRTIE